MIARKVEKAPWKTEEPTYLRAAYTLKILYSEADK